MKRPVRFTKLAEADLHQASDWYEAQGTGLGHRFVEHVWQAIDRIAENPNLYAALVGNVHRAGVPKFPYGIWYRIEPDESVVIACIHHRREPGVAMARALKPEPL